MKIIFYSSDSLTNKYGAIITDGLKENGIQLIKYEDAFKKISIFKSIDIVHLHWFETLGNNTSTNLKRFIGRAVKLLILKLSGKKIAWTMHNKIPHDQKSIKIKKALMRLIIWSSDIIIIHSKISEAILID